MSNVPMGEYRYAEESSYGKGQNNLLVINY